jgi:hypothetical protein
MKENKIINTLDIINNIKIKELIQNEDIKTQLKDQLNEDKKNNATKISQGVLLYRLLTAAKDLTEYKNINVDNIMKTYYKTHEDNLNKEKEKENKLKPSWNSSTNCNQISKTQQIEKDSNRKTYQEYIRERNAAAKKNRKR